MATSKPTTIYHTNNLIENKGEVALIFNMVNSTKGYFNLKAVFSSVLEPLSTNISIY
jgi:hypothetical protein